mmetsp:Transcript_32671/g.31889  ORF Transcript_32671/g.31889 Transcript_32671/m.31889 type:complete len:404 (+) Transcript_32671:2858-4069(+)
MSSTRAYLSASSPFSEEDKENADFYGYITVKIVWATIAFWFVISFVTGKTFLPTVFVFLAYQSILYLSMQDLYFDRRTRHYFTYFRPFRIEHLKINNWILDLEWIDPANFNTYVFNVNIYSIGEIYYNSFIVHNQLKLMILGAYFALLPIVTFFNFMLNHCTKLQCGWFHKHLGSQFFFGGTFLIIILFSVPFGLSCTLEVYKGERDNDYQMFSFVVSVLALILLLKVWVTIWFLIFYNMSHLNHPLLKEKYHFIFSPFKKHVLFVLLTPMYLTRRIALFGFLSILPTTTVGPLIINSFLSGFIFLYVIGMRPFKTVTNNVVLALTEIPCIAFGIYGLTFATSKHDFQLKAFWYYIYTDLGIICLVAFFLVVMSWFFLIPFFYKLRFNTKPLVLRRKKRVRRK